MGSWTTWFFDFSKRGAWNKVCGAKFGSFLTKVVAEITELWEENLQKINCRDVTSIREGRVSNLHPVVFIWLKNSLLVRRPSRDSVTILQFCVFSNNFYEIEIKKTNQIYLYYFRHFQCQNVVTSSLHFLLLYYKHVGVQHHLLSYYPHYFLSFDCFFGPI